MGTEPWYRGLVWLDYRLAVLFLVVIPLILLIWAFVQKAQPIQHLLIIYLRVASLLAITLYLLIAQYPVGFISGLIARILIPISLWFWIDLNDEIDYQQDGALKLVFTSWRWATTFYCILGIVALVPSIGCGFSDAAIKSSNCQVWLEAPLAYKDIFHANTKAPFLGVLGIIGLIIYLIYLSYFVIVRLGKQGRSATEQ
ncbi:MAG: DUF3177 family protein [Calothrix sp. C42_A2020_038]|nr:DUF3177 family protein [Calothrix sp. C42_A2020_038]